MENRKFKKESAKENKKSPNLSTITKYFYIYVFCSLIDREIENVYRINAPSPDIRLLS